MNEPLRELEREREPLVLVVDDDRRVRELLEVAFSAHGYRVITAADGDEAIRRAAADHPDLVVLDVRLPRRSGLEVCETLRTELADPLVPIILVSAATESETRLQAFHRGADDYLVKPFSPRELLARVKRLLTRHRELRNTRARLVTVEHDVARLAAESRRAQSDADRAGELRELALRTSAEFQRSRDLDALGAALLRAAQRSFDAPALALFVRDGETLWPCAVRGDEFARIASLRMDRSGDLACTLASLARPVHRHQLERLPEHAVALRGFAAAGFDLLAPVRSDDGLEAVIAFEERRHGHTSMPPSLEVIGALCAMAGPSLTHSIFALSRAVDAAEAAVGSSSARDAAAELCECAARHLSLPRRHQTAVRLAVRSAVGETFQLIGVAALDSSGFVQDLLARIDEARAASAPRIGAIDGAPAHVDPERARARDLIVAGWRIAGDLESGVPIDRALFHSRSVSATLAHALSRAHGEMSERAPEDVRVAARGAGE